MGESGSRAAAHATVYGVVQGVGFRYFIREHAERLKVGGWVRNAPDGKTVELVVEGEQPAVEEMLRRAGSGPPGARVQRVESEWITPQGQNQSFDIRH